ncbi:hypothetical protein FB567DRAFT_602019 [Paraphoma chrysanthemicola]|uniref:Uncharacterized protein n=1 Tax=Paraphoma chrysanthemicola TaxID=798071 RepID=A0A8K0W4R4_9PLEO|nr:hypothetical protein FB567DRAFT_602019 [Paraphoma chrysanthemicola]
MALPSTDSRAAGAQEALRRPFAGCCWLRLCIVDSGRARQTAAHYQTTLIARARSCPATSQRWGLGSNGLVTKSRRLDRSAAGPLPHARGMHARPCRLTTTAQPSNSDSTPDELVGNSASGTPSPFSHGASKLPCGTLKRAHGAACYQPTSLSQVSAAGRAGGKSPTQFLRPACAHCSPLQPFSGMHRFYPALLRAAREVIHHSALWLPHPPDRATRHSETLLVFCTLRLERPVASRLSCVTF